MNRWRVVVGGVSMNRYGTRNLGLNYGILFTVAPLEGHPVTQLPDYSITRLPNYPISGDVPGE
jgi:hypothetical protein